MSQFLNICSFKHYPDAPCIEYVQLYIYLPTFTTRMPHMWLKIPYMEHIWAYVLVFSMFKSPIVLSLLGKSANPISLLKSIFLVLNPQFLVKSPRLLLQSPWFLRSFFQERVVVSARGGGPQGLPFNEVNPSYEADQDIWGRALDLELSMAIGNQETLGFWPKKMGIVHQPKWRIRKGFT